MEQNISVVIPVMRWDLVRKLLFDVGKNTLQPRKITLINNSKIPIDLINRNKINGTDVEIIDFGRNIGVNAAWNYAMENLCPGDHLSILNDDIRVNHHFFENIVQAFNSDKKIGVVCPLTVTNIRRFQNRSVQNRKLLPMVKREGWAFTIRNSLVKLLPPIPKDLFIFCGDDWIWTWTHDFEYYWVKDTSNIIYHQIGGTLRKEEYKNLRALLHREKKAFALLIRERFAKNEKS